MANAKILIIDDDPDFVEATKVVLAEKGYDISTAYSGAEGLEQARGGAGTSPRSLKDRAGELRHFSRG